MKKRIISLFLALSLVFSLISSLQIFASANTEYIEGIYTYTVSNGEATITDCSTSVLGAIEIPSTLGGYPVTTIGDFAFSGCSSLTSITIPNSVTSIGSRAFSDCSSLTSITIPNSVKEIGSHAFNWCESLTSITIPNSVKEIGSYAFSLCKSLTSITIPNSVTTIGDGAFGYCYSLENITIPNSVTTIGSDAFSGCSSLTSITIPNSVTTIGDFAFSGCSLLTSITIPNSVTTIGDFAFSGCSSLTSITIPNSVTTIGDFAFSDCPSLTSITIPNSVKEIGSHAFNWCESLTSITIPNSVTTIENGAFSWCISLTSITIPNSVTGIEVSAFTNCFNLADVYYNGNKNDWNNIKIDSGNDYLTNATIHYNYKKPITKTYVMTFSPENNETDLSPVQSLQLYFNKNLNISSGKLRIKEYKTDITVKTFDISDCYYNSGSNLVVIPEVTLDSGARYYVTVDSGAVIGADGSPFYGIYDKNVWNFSTSNDKSLQKTTYVGLEYEQDGNPWWKKDNTDLPPVPKGTNTDYMNELDLWSIQHNVNSVHNHSNKQKILDMPVKIPVTDVNGQTFLLNDKATTVKQVMQDLIFIEHLQPYINKIDSELSVVNWYTDILKHYNDEKEIYNKVAEYSEIIEKYLNMREGMKKSNFFLSVAAPIAYQTLIYTATNNLGSQESSLVKVIADATIDSVALKNDISTISGANDYSTFKSGNSNVKNAVKIGKELYKIKTSGVSESVVKLSTDMFASICSSSNNQSLKMIGKTYSEIYKFKSAGQMSMFLGSSLGFFPYVVDLYSKGMEHQAEQTKAWYFVADYYISDKYPNIYSFVFDDEGFIIKKGLEKDAIQAEAILNSSVYSEYSNTSSDKILSNWCKFFDTEGVVKHTTDDIVGVRRDLVNVVNILKYAKTVNVEEVKENLLNYISAELNKGKTTEVYGKCPIEIKIYDKENNLLAKLSSINPNDTNTEYGSFYLMGDDNNTKYFILASDEYRMEIVPYEDGEMTIAMMQKDENGEIIESSYYENVSIKKDEVYSADLSSEKPVLSLSDVDLTDVEAVAESITITAPSNEVACDSSILLTAIVYPEYATDKSVVWSVDDESVATVDENGNLTGISDGVVTVSATAVNGVYKSEEFFVYTPISQINSEITEIVMMPNEEYTVNISVEPVSSTRTINWSSSVPSVAIVDENGTITAKSKGEAIITAEADGVKKEFYVEVSENHLNISLYQSDIEGDRVKIDIQNMSCINSFTDNIFVAVYEQNKLIKIVPYTMELTVQESFSDYFDIELSGTESEVKAFIWNDIIKPLQDVKGIPLISSEIINEQNI